MRVITIVGLLFTHKFSFIPFIFHNSSPCGQCGYQATTKGNLAEHKRALHEGVKYPCGQCGYQSTTKGDIAQHKRAVHEGVKYPCGQCGHQSTSKKGLARHQKVVHERINSLLHVTDKANQYCYLNIRSYIKI